MQPFLFEYYSTWSGIKYIMVCAPDHQKAYAKVDAYLNRTQQLYTITLATITPDMEVDQKA